MAIQNTRAPRPIAQSMGATQAQPGGKGGASFSPVRNLATGTGSARVLMERRRLYLLIQNTETPGSGRDLRVNFDGKAGVTSGIVIRAGGSAEWSDAVPRNAIEIAGVLAGALTAGITFAVVEG